MSERDRGRPGDPRASTSTASRTPTRRRTTSSSRAAASRTSSSRRSPSTRTSRTGCASSGTSRSTTSSRGRCPSGAATSPRSTSRTSSTTSGRPRSRPRAGRTCPPTSSTPGTSSASRRRRRSTSPASARSTSRRSSTTSSRPTSRRRASSSSTWTRGLREHEELVKQYFGTIIPQNDNKFAALNSAVWSGGSFIYVPPGVSIDMPLQAYFRINAENMGQFERTLIIVDEDAYVHYVEGCTAPIYSSDSLHSRGRRDHRQAARPLPLHDDPELVEQRLQPRHQARRRLRGRDDGVGRRQPRLEADDEVPGHLAARRARARRGALDRLRRQGAAPGRGRQVRPRRAEHDVGDHLQVDLEERRPRRLPRPARGRQGRRRLEVEGRLRRAHPRRGVALRHVPVHPRRRERGRASATRRPSRRSARSSSST